MAGGTGALGKLIAERLRPSGHEIRVLSRRPGRGPVWATRAASHHLMAYALSLTPCENCG
ncbi:hypothetical protein [Nocardia cyriacigeorgica]|uniref:hypothetical protein n=1 Tax=Nocardia cyriacigeorgica TaxID=135487 RepID=UPI003CC7D1FE